MNTAKMLHIRKYPSGRYGFVGLVPGCLAFVGSPHDLEVARHSGPALAARIAKLEGRHFAVLSWPTLSEAQQAASAAGFLATYTKED